MKKFVSFFTVLAVAACLLALPVSAEDGEGDFRMPGAIVDLASRKGFEDFCAKAEQYDLISLTTGEYTIHGTNGLVKWEFIEEDGESFTRFQAIEPLDENGKDSDGNRPPNEGDFRMTAEIEFSIDEYDYISFCYRTSPKAHLSQNHIYIRDDSHSGEFEATTGMWTPYGLRNKGEWTVRTIQISKSFTDAKGTFKSIRIPIAGRVNEYFDLKYIVVYNDKDSCSSFDIAAYHEATGANEPDPTEEPTAEPTKEPEAEPTEEPRNEPSEEPEATFAPSPESKKTGCGSFAAGSTVLIIAASFITAAGIKKKNDE